MQYGRKNFVEIRHDLVVRRRVADPVGAGVVLDDDSDVFLEMTVRLEHVERSPTRSGRYSRGWPLFPRSENR